MADVGKIQSPDNAGWYVKDSSGTARQVANSSGELFSAGAGINSLPVIESTATNLAAYGVSLLPYSTAAGVQYTLGAPIPGVKKTLILNATGILPDSTADQVYVYTGSTAVFILDGSTVVTSKQKVQFQPPMSAVELVGLSANNWMLTWTQGVASLTS